MCTCKNDLSGMPLPAQMQHIRQKLVAYFLERDTFDDGATAGKCYTSRAGDYLALQQPDGHWADVDYYCTETAANGKRWEPYLALDRMQAMAMAYADPQSPWYQQDSMLQGVENAFAYWAGIRDANREKDDYEGPWSINWWENGNGVQLRFSRIGVVLKGALSDFAVGVILRKLDVNGSTGSGQNALWCTQNALYRALLAEDAAQLKKVVDTHLAVNLRRGGLLDEAIQVDNSFHCHGHLLYSNGYGASLFRDMSFWIDTLAGTTFALPQPVIDLMATYMLDGLRWMMRGDILEIGLGYTPRDKHRYAGMYIAPLERMIQNDPVHAAAYQQLLDSIRFDSHDAYHGLSGNHFMWTSALMCHMREGYGLNIRMNHAGMKSSEWRATWPDTDYGNLIFWTADATASVMIDGDEYYAVYKDYDWRHVPGVTAPFDIAHNYWFENDRNDCCGVSNGRQGATAYTFDKQSTRGTIGYFLFDKEYVALGAGISSAHPQAIHTTINQTKAGKDAQVNGQPVPAGSRDMVCQAAYVYNNRIGYIFPQATTVHVADFDHKTAGYPSIWSTGYAQFGEQLNPDEVPDKTDNTFSLWMDHGVQPHAGSYAYIVLPGVTPQETEVYSRQLPVTIVANTKQVQAVRHHLLKQTQIHFYTAGQLAYDAGKTVEVDGPCSLIIDEAGEAPVVHQAVSNTQPQAVRTVVLTIGEQTMTRVFTAADEPYAGQTQVWHCSGSTE